MRKQAVKEEIAITISKFLYKNENKSTTHKNWKDAKRPVGKGDLYLNILRFKKERLHSSQLTLHIEDIEQAKQIRHKLRKEWSNRDWKQNKEKLNWKSQRKINAQQNSKTFFFQHKMKIKDLGMELRDKVPGFNTQYHKKNFNKTLTQ